MKTQRQYIDAGQLWNRIVHDIAAADTWHTEIKRHESDVLLRVLRYIEAASHIVVEPAEHDEPADCGQDGHQYNVYGACALCGARS